MALNSMGLGVTFTARDAMSGTLFRLQRAFSGLEVSSRTAVAAIGAGFASMAAGIAVATAGLAGLETGFNLASKTAAFEASIMRVGLVAGNTAPAALQQMGDAAINAAQATGFATADVSKGLEEIAALGFSSEEALMLLGPTLNFAAAGGVNMAQAAETMGAAMKVFSLEATPENMKAVANQLVGIANTTGLQANDLRIALGTVGRGASAAKQQLDEVLIMMGLVKNTGVDATVAASSVSSALLFMAENAGKFRKLGIEVEDANGKVRKMGDIFLDLNEVLKKNPHMTENIAVVKDLLQRFGITAYQGVIEQLGSGNIKDDVTKQAYRDAEALGHLRDEMAKFKTGDLAAENAEKMISTFDGLGKRLTVIWDTLGIELGRGFVLVLQEPLKWLVEGLQGIERFLRSMPPSIKKFAAGAFLMASAMTLASGAALILGGAITIVAAVITLAGAPLLAWMGTFLAIALPLAAVAAVLTGVMLAFGGGLALVFSKNLGGATDKLMEFYNKWKLIVSATLAFLDKGELTGALHEEFGAADSETQDTVKRFYLFFEKLKAGFLAMTDTISTLLSDKAVPALQAIWKEFGNLTDKLGLTDNIYGRLTAAMTKGDMEQQGKLLGETLANAFLGIAKAVVIALKVLWEVVEVMQTLWRFKATIIGAAFGGFAGAAAGLLVDAAVMGHEYMDAKEIAANGGKPVMGSQDRIRELEAELHAIGLRQNGVPATPAATVAQLSAEQQQQGYANLYDIVKNAKNMPKDSKVQIIENKLYLDGKMVYESVREHAKAESNDSFGGDGMLWSEEPA